MYRLTFALLASVLTGGILPALPTAPPPRAVSPYYPTKVGTKWVYESNTSNEVRIITVAEVKDGAKLVTMAWELELPSGKTKAVDRMRVSEDGVFKLGVDDKVYDPPECVLKLPHVPGRVWEWRRKGDDKFTVTYAAGAPEEVKAPAGTFMAIPVERVLTTEGFRFEQTEWYAPHVGVVKRQWSTKKGIVDGTVVLKSFTPGKD